MRGCTGLIITTEMVPTQKMDALDKSKGGVSVCQLQETEVWGCKSLTETRRECLREHS